MARFVQQQFMFTFIVSLLFIHSSMQDKSISDMNAPGQEFIPADKSLPPLLTFIAKKLLYCSLECNKRIDCRTFDYDSNSRQCRLWDAGMTTGSIVLSPSKLQSFVGTIRLLPSMYANIHNQSCDKCTQSRYETCDMNSGTCQCPPKTYWNGTMCLTQLLQNQTCSQDDMCRSDLNLTCQPSCDFTYRYSVRIALGIGQTVAGFCNGTVGSDVRGLNSPWGIYISPSDGTLYVSDYGNVRYQAFTPFSSMEHTVISSGITSTLDIFVDGTGTIYVTDGDPSSGVVHVKRAGMNMTTFPAAGLSTTSCPLTGLYSVYSIAADRSGNMYISIYWCCMVFKWMPNATTGTLVAGRYPRSRGSASDKLAYIRYIHLNEDRGALYVTDTGNNRVQKFIIGGNGTGITVAGNGVSGLGMNQLNSPTEIWVTRDGQTLYVADTYNNRVMKWTIGASQGSVVGGDANGVSGTTPELLNYLEDIALDPSETYLYVSQYYNHRVQRFRIR